MMTTLLAFMPNLVPNFVTNFKFASVIFAACSFNLGPRTVTYPHVDVGYLIFGWCAITALGNFDPDVGRHLILWDLGLIIRFPPGSTILIPSALLCHSFTSIREHETRYSFTQYTAGGLFRWVDDGCQSQKDAVEKLSPSEIRAREDAMKTRFTNGVSMMGVVRE